MSHAESLVKPDLYQSCLLPIWGLALIVGRLPEIFLPLTIFTMHSLFEKPNYKKNALTKSLLLL